MTDAPPISAIAFPAPGVVLERAAADDFNATLRSWMSVTTDRVLALDALCQAVGPDAVTADRADVAAAFLAHQAIGARLSEMGTPDGLKMVAELSRRPVFAGDGSLVANNVADACVLLEAVVERAEASLNLTATTAHEAVRMRSAINADLAVARQLAERLGDQVRHVNGLATKAAAALARQGSGSDHGELIDLAAQIKAVRTTLQAADADRQRLIDSWPTIPLRIERMAVQEATIRLLRIRCADKVRPLPNLAVPSTTAFESPLAPDEVESRPWPAVEAHCRMYLRRLDRLQAALDEAQRRYGEPLRERDELRGLVQAFHDKAGHAGLDEHTDLDPAYRAAVEQLWSAPCDLVIARELVDRYVRAVNTITNGETAVAASGRDAPDASGARDAAEATGGSEQ